MYPCETNHANLYVFMALPRSGPFIFLPALQNSLLLCCADPTFFRLTCHSDSQCADNSNHFCLPPLHCLLNIHGAPRVPCSTYLPPLWWGVSLLRLICRAGWGGSEGGEWVVWHCEGRKMHGWRGNKTERGAKSFLPEEREETTPSTNMAVSFPFLLPLCQEILLCHVGSREAGQGWSKARSLQKWLELCLAHGDIWWELVCAHCAPSLRRPGWQEGRSHLLDPPSSSLPHVASWPLPRRFETLSSAKITEKERDGHN